jgi:hypothetical protein
MEDDARIRRLARWGLGAAGLSSVGAAFVLPQPYRIIGGGSVLLLFLLLFGGYYLWQRRRARRQREQFTSAIEAQTAAAPKSISDPKKRADLDKVRGKFQTGLQEFKSRGKDIYKLPWYAIIGESGSGKTEAIRHSGIDFPPGLNKEHQGTGGTVNMDWWFTNRGVILDTAGSMVFPEAGAGETPEWQEFLRLLKKARPHCPINGLFLVLSIESLIKDSADRISQKASRLAQHLDLIQRTLDVRFPVYLLVTKCDLLIGFREFFDSIEDPLLQHQIFGWSNPDPLDATFRPDLVAQHLGSVAERLRRRRMALLREASGPGRGADTQQFFSSSYQPGSGTAAPRRLDEMDSLFALPESVMRLAPRLRRYLETIFVAGEWSAKPVFLRGIYFTSSMREGKALDEAIAFATGLSLDQLPEARTWEKDRAFFLRDLFHEKVFRESGLVTRATNTLKLLRQRQLAIFGSAGLALLLLLVFAGIGAHDLKVSVGKEAKYWQAGTNNWKKGEWSPPIVHSGTTDVLHFVYQGTNLVEVADEPTLIRFHEELKQKVNHPLAVGLFKPIVWLGFGEVKDRPRAQRVLFEGSVLKPLVRRTRDKMIDTKASLSDPEALRRHREALVGLMQLEADRLVEDPKSGLTGVGNKPEKYLKTFLAYLTDSDSKVETNLVNLLAWTYARDSLAKSQGEWPPKPVHGGVTLTSNHAIRIGLARFYDASRAAQTNIEQHLELVDKFADNLHAYYVAEDAWLKSPKEPCQALKETLRPAKDKVDDSWSKLQMTARFGALSNFGSLTNLTFRYLVDLTRFVTNASGPELSRAVDVIVSSLPEAEKTRGLFREIREQLRTLTEQAARNIQDQYNLRREWIPLLDRDCLAQARSNGPPVYELRWSLYTNACALASAPVQPVIGDGWKRYTSLIGMANEFRANLGNYNGPLRELTSDACRPIAADALQKLQGQFAVGYVELVDRERAKLALWSEWDIQSAVNARILFGSVESDLASSELLGSEAKKLDSIRSNWPASKESVLKAIDTYIRGQLGFPVILNAKTTMNVTNLVELKKFLDRIQTELTNPVWTNFPEGATALASLRGNIESHRSVTRGLVIDGPPSDSPAKFKILFVTHNDTKDGSDYDFTKEFRYVKLKLGSQDTGEKEVTTTQERTILLGEGSLDLGITFLFRRQVGGPIKEEVENWTLPRLIHDGKATSDDGKTWRIRLTPRGAQKVVFEVQLDPSHPLPRVERPLARGENWPK